VSWLQIELRATPASLPAIEQALLDGGAVSIALLSDADEPVLEPAPGETPLWSNVRVQALYSLDADLTAVRHAVATLPPEWLAKMQVSFLGARDAQAAWQEALRRHAVDHLFSGRLHLLPKAADVAPRSGVVQLRLDPGLAFGTGGHPTTRMCLEWIAAHIERGQRVLDFGCGSGVLGIAAALLGAKVVAVDHDSQALVATRENAAYNGLSEHQVSALSLEAWQARPQNACFDVVVANILAEPLESLAGMFEQAAAPGAAIVLSGILPQQAGDVMARYAHTVFEATRMEDGWACLIGRTAAR